MFFIVTLRNTIRIMPKAFSGDVKAEALSTIKADYENTIMKDLGYVIAVVDVLDIEIGKILPREEGIFSRCTFQLLIYKPEMNEIVEGIVAETVEFGVFIRLGPTDGLCHVSQVTDDYINYNSKMSTLEGKETGRILKTDDLVRARIVALSPASSSKAGKLGLSMRRPFLGKLEWIEEDLQGGPKREKGEKKQERKKEGKAGKKRGR